MAGPAFVTGQAVSGSSASGTTAVTLNGVTAGNLLFAYGAWDNTAAPGSGSMSGGGTWTFIASEPNSGTGHGGAGLWICAGATGGNTTVTFAPGASPASFLAVAEYNPNGQTTADTSNKNANTAGTTTTVNPGTVTTANANDAVLVGGSNGSADTTWTAGSGYTVRTSITSSANLSGGIQDQTLSATQSGFATAFGNTSPGWTAIAAAIKAGAAAAAQNPYQPWLPLPILCS